MRKLFILFFVVGLTGCSDNIKVEKEFICSGDSVEDRSSFILQCLANANPKSDEEPEDWITLCERMAERAYCETAQFKYTYSHQWDFISKTLITD